MLPPIYRAIVADQQDQLQRLIRTAGVIPVRRLYQDMLSDVASKIKLAQSGSFTAQQLQGMLTQIRHGLARVQEEVGQTFASAVDEVGMHTATSTIANTARLERHFTGAEMSLPVMQIARLRGIVADRAPSLMRVHESSMASFGGTMMGQIESALASSLAGGESQSKSVDKIMQVGDMSWSRADCIVRTELSFASNAAARDVNDETAEELGGDMWSQWTEHVSDSYQPLDDRVAVDSIAMHMQVAAPGEMFTQPPTTPLGEEVQSSLVGDSWLCPPNRPNDRAVLVPWRANWGTPGWQWVDGRRQAVTETHARRKNAAWSRARGRAAEEEDWLTGVPVEPDDGGDDDDDEDDDGQDEVHGIGFDSPIVGFNPEPRKLVKRIPAHEVAGELEATEMVDPESLVDAGWFEEPGLTRHELDRGAIELVAGQPVPVEIGVAPDDSLIVKSGRGQLNAAADLGHPVRVQWDQHDEGAELNHILRGRPPAETASPYRTLGKAENRPELAETPEYHFGIGTHRIIGAEPERKPLPPGYELVQTQKGPMYRHLISGRTYTEDALRPQQQRVHGTPQSSPPEPEVTVKPIELPEGWARKLIDGEPYVYVPGEPSRKPIREADVRAGHYALIPRIAKPTVLGKIGGFFRALIKGR